MARIVVTMAASPERAFAYFADPRNRPAWQSSLRSVGDVVLARAPALGVGDRWTDRTWVPGVQPRMVTTRSEPPLVWAEEGTWGPFAADLTLTFRPTADGTEVAAEFAVRGARLGPLLTALGRPAVASDLRRAAKILDRG